MASSPASRRTRAGLSAWVAAAALAATVFVAPSASAATPIGQPVVGGDTAVYGTGCRYPVGVVVDPRTPKTNAPTTSGKPADGRVQVDKPVTKDPKDKKDPKAKKKVSKYVYFWDMPAGAKPGSGDATLIAWTKPNAKGVAVVNWTPKTSGFRDVYVRYHNRWSKPTQVTVEDAVSLGRLCLLRFW
mgnify:FL=1